MLARNETSKATFDGFYKGKSVLVTGHTGFKGSWLALWLHELGAKVTGLALPPSTTPSHFERIRLKDLVRHIESDIRDLQSVKHAIDIAKPEIVFHLAAQALVRDSYDDPKLTFDTNIGGTVNVLEAIRHCPTVKAVVVVTSDKCYENKEWVWGYRESDPIWSAAGGSRPVPVWQVQAGATSYLAVLPRERLSKDQLAALRSAAMAGRRCFERGPGCAGCHRPEEIGALVRPGSTPARAAALGRLENNFTLAPGEKWYFPRIE